MRKKRYVFLSNSNKPTEEEQHSRKPVSLTNVSRPCLKIALDMGYEVWFGTNRSDPDELPCELPVHMYDSHTYRSIINFKDNYIAYKNLMRVLSRGDFEVIHCNTPIGGVIGRLCGKKAHINKVIYTAHGFHFYKGAPLINRTFLKWAEMIMAHWTDVIITMNREDYEAAKKFHIRNNGNVYYIPGVGINTEEYREFTVDKDILRNEMGLSINDCVCISMGDLIPRKNYKTAIEAIAKCKIKNVHYLICGEGPEMDILKQFASECKISDRIHFLGFRTDIKALLKISDIFLFSTLQEGMPRSMMEAMASGLPCIASNIRGNVDLLDDGKGGFLVSPNDTEAFAQRIHDLAIDSELRERMAQNNLERIKQFDVKEVEKILREIYQRELA